MKSGFRRSLRAAFFAIPLACLAGIQGTAQSSEKNELVVATMWESLPLRMEARRSRFFNESEILDTLVKLDYEMNLMPGLATSWERTSPTDWVFVIREGALFHDGTPLDAAAVKDSLERVIDLLPYAQDLLDIESMEVLGEHRLRITTGEPFAALPNQLTDAFTGIYARSSFDEKGNFVEPIGTGPYRFVEYVKQDRTIVERFDRYWGEAPDIERIVYRYIPDHNSRVLALESGEIDLAFNIPPADVARLAEMPDYQVHREPTAGLYYLVINTGSEGPLSDVRLRHAVSMLIDREALVMHALDGIGIPAREFFSPTFPWVPGGVPKSSFDPHKAAALLQAAGYEKKEGRWQKDGEPLALDLLSYSGRTEMPLVTETVSGMLRAAGVETNVTMLTWPGMLDRVKQGDYDGYVVYWTPEMTGHPDLHLMAHFHSGSGLDYNGYVNPELDRLLEKGRTLDPGQEQQSVYHKALTIIQDDAPVAPLVHKVYVAASDKSVENFRIHPSGFFYDFKEVSKR